MKHQKFASYHPTFADSVDHGSRKPQLIHNIHRRRFASRLRRWAIAKGYADATPFARAGLPTLRMRPEHARARRLIGDEGARLLAACGPHLRNRVIAALEIGCRKQELLSLQWSQVHWERNELVLPVTKTKTKRPRRIPISAALHAVLVRRRTHPSGARVRGR